MQIREHTPVASLRAMHAGHDGLRQARASVWTQARSCCGGRLASSWRRRWSRGGRGASVKGQILRLHDPAGAGLLSRAVRHEGGYVLPRGDGRYVLGATVEERGFELQPTAGGVYELLREAHELLPGISELELDEVNVGLRPGSPDNAPVIGRAGIEGLIWASGHHRNGILLAPLSAELVLGLLDPAAARDAHARLLDVCDPHRFAAAAAPGAGSVTAGIPLAGARA